MLNFKIFISSRNNDPITIDTVPGESLTEIRRKLKAKLESELFMGKPIFEVKINEDFAADASKDSYQTCLDEIKDSDFTIVLYNGYAGWAPPAIEVGICHAEMEQALAVSQNKTAVIDIREFALVNSVEADEIKRNKAFEDYLLKMNRFGNPVKLMAGHRSSADFEEELYQTVLSTLSRHFETRIKLSNQYFSVESNNKVSLDWKKLKYSDRDKAITRILKKLISNSVYFPDVTRPVFSIPDNMSREDAKAFAGRPFLNDPILYDAGKTGPIHFVGVFGTATETQVKNVIGYTDVSVVVSDFGLYVWEQTTHIQMVFLTKCRTEEAINMQFLAFNNWIISSEEYENLLKRAEARTMILAAVNAAKALL
ncbi:DUF4062 domain-containing protein [Mucilaginibacter conchicola]|uniref:DUF4062 domain-containing protein n=1 Tax=Mucilaginibacter conchicola TaxID=2303333 RepID=A0A372NQK8_9SPHI|nr:DUF4062 domain-containing protein [Mucilaginibacter conchicola]RFZ91226.1 DUF4062 domain-containing protein [Mucilaginibacter conchicola]